MDEELPEGMMGDSSSGRLDSPSSPVHLVDQEGVEDDSAIIEMISEQVTGDVFHVLQDSFTVRNLAQYGHRKVDDRFERELFDDEEVGKVLQGVYLNTEALLRREKLATTELAETDKVGILINQCTEGIKAMLKFPFGPDVARTRISSFDEQLAHEEIAPTDPLVGQILQQVWSKLGMKMKTRR